MAETHAVAAGNGPPPILRVVDARPGYCLLCYGPAVVAVLELHGWSHRFDACLACLDRLAHTARDAVGRVAGELRSAPLP